MPCIRNDNFEYVFINHDKIFSMRVAWCWGKTNKRKTHRIGSIKPAIRLSLNASETCALNIFKVFFIILQTRKCLSQIFACELIIEIIQTTKRGEKWRVCAWTTGCCFRLNGTWKKNLKQINAHTYFLEPFSLYLYRLHMMIHDRKITSVLLCFNEILWMHSICCLGSLLQHPEILIFVSYRLPQHHDSLSMQSCNHSVCVRACVCCLFSIENNFVYCFYFCSA